MTEWKNFLRRWLPWARRGGAEIEEEAAEEAVGACPPDAAERPLSIERTDPIAALREPGYRLFLAGSLLSNTGNQMRTVAVNWEVYQRTQQPLSLGIIGLVLALPVIVLALPAGAAADRRSRRGIIIF
jgi:hypothetical protein